MSDLRIGMTLSTMEDPGTGDAPRWRDVQRRAVRAEEVGFDTVWVADELQWEMEAWDSPRGWWECLSLIGAMAASTSTIGVGTWVLSALHRNPGLIAKAAETLDEISDGRFILGFGSGHAGRQGEAFGFPPNYTVSRYEEALSIVTALRGEGKATFHGKYHSAVDQVLAPRGPRESRCPLMLGGHGPRTMRLAVDHADIWSAYATNSSQPEAFSEMLDLLDSICRDVGRDPGSIGRSIGVFVVAPGVEPEAWVGGKEPIQGSESQITDTFLQFESMGCTRIELMLTGDVDASIEAFAPVLAAVKRA
ncbi:MAG: LLM class F420-dependent oxidoreductase [Acidimicrobiia bacterium]|nr:MAG: LLM class F420-dependent oxidoreductase [Acidimicrobiia bacterium]